MKLDFCNPGLSLTDMKGKMLEFPDLTVITGVMSAGKSHLLKEIERQSIKIEPEGCKFICRDHSNFREENPGINTMSGIFEHIEGRYKVYTQQKGRTIHYEQKASNNNTDYQFISKKATKPVGSLELIDFELYIPFIESKCSLLTCFMLYRYREILNQDNKTAGVSAYLTQDEFEKTYGKAPWDLLNDILRRFNDFDYSISTPKEVRHLHSTIPFHMKLIREKDNLSLDFGGLSSGEAVVFCLAKMIFDNEVERHETEKVIFLLDEIDAVLHPKLSQDLMETLQSPPLNKYKTILVTHSPSTVAFAKEESIFVMSKEEPRIQKQSKADAIRILSSGAVTLTKEEADFDLQYNIDEFANQKDTILCVEGVTDKIILKSVWKKLYGGDLPFFILPCFNKDFLYILFSREEFFNDNKGKCFISLFDFDDAFSQWDQFNDETLSMIEEKKCNVKHSCRQNKYSMLLPVPDFRKEFVSIELAEKSSLTIELLFKDKNIPIRFMSGQIYRPCRIAKGSKMKFAEHVRNNVEEMDCEAFHLLFETVKNIYGGVYEK